ncbi:MAG: preprotein translocase subunit YajC [Melioribacteraceae bacterium]|nr:preprotein translocase subunit YajC [Melioribacteraceae bacterium]MCF8353051.1 preprotein translocase subunit YajC [Melioribacteraceae bacterium]MCF8392942.1 preprotein translocase subunit YajC [Melioribacteraceae bacterium]MCF8417763.1 preprotein translocase subunit YajC [Melioribacteraceae bacterium]
MNYLLAMAPQGGDGGGSLVSTLIMFGAIFAIFYFMIIRPQQKKAKEREAMLSAIKKGDKIITSGGLHATVSGLDEKTCLLDVGNNVKMKFERSAIATIVAQKDDN